MAEPMIVKTTAAAVHPEAGRPRLHQHRDQRAARTVIRGEVESKIDAAWLKHPLGLGEGVHDDVLAEFGAEMNRNVQRQRRGRERRDEQGERQHAGEEPIIAEAEEGSSLSALARWHNQPVHPRGGAMRWSASACGAARLTNYSMPLILRGARAEEREAVNAR